MGDEKIVELPHGDVIFTHQYNGGKNVIVSTFKVIDEKKVEVAVMIELKDGKFNVYSGVIEGTGFIVKEKLGEA